ncbi:MAG: hypothetical protein EAZ95_07985 [Bacteroidetes bacterium]|nr:MAG: hypothetical protein EAZ95_07985 [Bacteroidota bacterium]
MTVKTPLNSPEDDLEVAPELEKEFLRLDKRLDRVNWYKKIGKWTIWGGFILLLAFVCTVFLVESPIYIIYALMVHIIILFVYVMYIDVFEKETKQIFVDITNQTDAKAFQNPLYRVGKYKYVISKFYANITGTHKNDAPTLIPVGNNTRALFSYFFTVIAIISVFFLNEVSSLKTKQQQAKIDSLHRVYAMDIKDLKTYITDLQEKEKKIIIPENKSIIPPKPSDSLPTVQCADIEKCLRELETERNEAKRKALIDALLPNFDEVRVVGSRGTQVGIYNQERGNLWIGLDKIGDSYYKYIRREGRKLTLQLQVSN